MMKNKLYILLFTLVCFLLLAACGLSQGDQIEQEQAEQEEQAEQTEQEEQQQEEQTEPEEEKEPREVDEIKQTDEDDLPIVTENEAFRIFEPTPNSEVESGFLVRGEARVYEATVLYELFDENENVIAQGFTTATDAGPNWGEFEFNVEWENNTGTQGILIIFDESAEDGSIQNFIEIPLRFQ